MEYERISNKTQTIRTFSFRSEGSSSDDVNLSLNSHIYPPEKYRAPSYCPGPFAAHIRLLRSLELYTKHGFDG
jgi:hypothetical protein